MLVDPGNVGFALDGQIVLRWRFFFQVFSGLSPPPWQAPKYSAGRDGSDWTQLGMIISGNRIRSARPDMPVRSRGATRPSCTCSLAPSSVRGAGKTGCALHP